MAKGRQYYNGDVNLPAFLTASQANAYYSFLVTRQGAAAGLCTTATNCPGFTSGDLNQDAGNFNDRPYVSPGVSSLRNSYRNRSLRFLDLRLQRYFKFGEKFEVAPSVEVFNVFNFKNITLASTTATNYGNPASTRTLAQFWLRPIRPSWRFAMPLAIFC